MSSNIYSNTYSPIYKGITIEWRCFPTYNNALIRSLTICAWHNFLIYCHLTKTVLSLLLLMDSKRKFINKYWILFMSICSFELISIQILIVYFLVISNILYYALYYNWWNEWVESVTCYDKCVRVSGLL